MYFLQTSTRSSLPCLALTIPSVSEPNVPLLIQALGMRVEMLAVTWDAPVSGLVEKYTVKFKDIPGTSQDVMVSSARRAQFTGLIAGKQYTVVVAAVSGVLGSGGQKSEDAEGQFYTSKSNEQFRA